MKISTLFFTSMLLAYNLHCEGARIECRTLEEFKNAGWIGWISSFTSYARPSEWNETLRPLDSSVTGGSVWGTNIRYGKLFRLNIELCHVTYMRINVTYYMENSKIYIEPCKDPDNVSKQCYQDSPTSVEWIRTQQELEVTVYENQPYPFVIVLAGVGLEGFVFFDEISVEHDGIDDGSCSLSTTTGDPATAITEEPTTHRGTENPTTPPATEDPNSCNHDCEYRRVDCHVYYTCVNFTYKEFHTCELEDGLAFNPSLKTCDVVENVDGCGLPVTNPPPDNCVCEYRPDETDCSKYFFCPDSCQENLCEHRSCPAGLAWNVDKYGDGSGHQQCTLPQNATCAGYDPIVEFSCKNRTDGVYRNPKDCHSFWKCINGQALLFDCPHGFIYNPGKLECNFPGKAMRFCEKH